MDSNAIRRQSESAYNQWCEKWREHAKLFAESGYSKNNMHEFVNIGVGRSALLVANGYTLEEEIESLKENYKNKTADIWACDKTIGHLLENGIVPDFCIVCDAVVDYEKYLEKYKDQLQDTILFTNVCGNPKWWQNGNWKKVFGFVNQDILKSEVEFMQLSGCRNVIPAATNVSGAMLVFVTQCSNRGRNNFFGYDMIGLLGFDYSWRANGNYYAFDEDGGGKRYYMKHIYAETGRGDLAFTSTNLAFSAQWIHQYINGFKLPVVQTNKRGILILENVLSVEKVLNYKYRSEDCATIRVMTDELLNLEQKVLENRQRIVNIGKNHWRNYLSSV